MFGAEFGRPILTYSYKRRLLSFCSRFIPIRDLNFDSITSFAVLT